MEDKQLNNEQSHAVDLIRSGENVLITGSAGTGKSFLIDYLSETLSVTVTATTGIAAQNIRGKTLHSFAGIFNQHMTPEQIYEKTLKTTVPRIVNCRRLIIDEVSMLSPELFEFTDELFRLAKGVDLPFGGVQMIFVGDFLQLPPVTKGKKEPSFCFESPVWKEMNIKKVHLKQVYRQKDKHFASLLEKIRTANIDEEVIEVFSNLPFDHSKVPEWITPSILVGTNKECDHVNYTNLFALDSEDRVYKATEYMIRESEAIKKMFQNIKDARNIEDNLRLKVGAQVMMTSNAYASEYGVVNGSIGSVEEMNDGSVLVKFENGEEINVGIQEYAVEDREAKYGSIYQIPLILAWAITIHKSQGMSISYLLCDLAKIFAPSQVYVALSRARTLGGLFVKNFKAGKVFVNKKALAFYQS